MLGNDPPPTPTIRFTAANPDTTINTAANPDATNNAVANPDVPEPFAANPDAHALRRT